MTSIPIGGQKVEAVGGWESNRLIQSLASFGHLDHVDGPLYNEFFKLLKENKTDRFDQDFKRVGKHSLSKFEKMEFRLINVD